MTLSELRYVVAVAQEKNFRRAAEKCFVTQPALSIAIQKLEGELSVRLFERGKSEVSVTPLSVITRFEVKMFTHGGGDTDSIVECPRREREWRVGWLRREGF